MGFIEQNRLFATLPKEELALTERSSERRNFGAGEQIFREGDQGDGLYLLTQGLVQISALVAGNERRVLSQIKPGDFFGEMAVLDGEPRCASASAEIPTETVFIRRESMLEAIDRSPRLAVTLIREFSARTREFNQRYIHEVVQAERLSALGRFARTIVHDFKNPLHIIGLAAELVEMEGVSADMRKTASQRIRKQVERLSNMVSELLEFTRAPQRDLVLAGHNYAQYVNGIITELRPEVQDKGVKLIVESEVPFVTVPLDPKRLLHVFTNLVHNAVEALQGPGEIRLRFRVAGNEVITEVADSGKGIAPEIAARLFEPFATFGKAKGSGLGLSICRKIVEDHRGWIRARNEPGSGAVFSFGLPVVT
jgi:signal transduction histidine kinase